MLRFLGLACAVAVLMLTFPDARACPPQAVAQFNSGYAQAFSAPVVGYSQPLLMQFNAANYGIPVVQQFNAGHVQAIRLRNVQAVHAAPVVQQIRIINRRGFFGR